MKKSLLLFAAVACLVVGGCSTKLTGTVSVRALNLASNAGNLDIAADLGLITTNLAFTSGTNYKSLTSGQQSVLISGTGTSNVFASTSFNFVPGDIYSIVAIGLTGNGTHPPQALVIRDDLGSTGSGQTRLRFLNAAAAQTVNLDVYVTAVAADLTTATPAAANLAYATVSPAFAADEATSKTYEIRVTPTGNKTTILADIQITPAAGNVLTVAITDLSGGTGVQALTYLDRH